MNPTSSPSSQAVLDTLPSSHRFALITFGASVSIYDLSHADVACAHVIDGSDSLSPPAREELLYGAETFLAPLHTCRGTAQALLSSLRPYRGGEAQSERKRSLGAAVEVALALVRGPAVDLPRSPMKRTGGTSRVVVCTGGPVTYGEEEGKGGGSRKLPGIFHLYRVCTEFHPPTEYRKKQKTRVTPLK